MCNISVPDRADGLEKDRRIGTCLDWRLNCVCSYFDIKSVLVLRSLLAGKLPQRSSLWALSLSLSAVNLSESAKMPAAQLVEIYVTAATALRVLLGHHLSFLPASVTHTVSAKAQRTHHDCQTRKHCN